MTTTSQLQDRINEIAERTQREANALPLAAARERRAQGIAELRRLAEAEGGVSLRAVPKGEHTAAMLQALSKGRRS